MQIFILTLAALVAIGAVYVGAQPWLNFGGRFVTESLVGAAVLMLVAGGLVALWAAFT